MFNFPSVDGVPGRNGERVQHHARRAEESSSTSAPWRCSFRTASPFATDSALELGMRYEWHVTPTERDDRFIVFDARRRSLMRVGVDVDEIYQQNNANVEPRVGIAWSALRRRPHRGARRLRAGRGPAEHDGGQGHGRQPAVRDAADGTGLDFPRRAIETTRPVGLAPTTVDPGFRNASLQSWNVNLQRQIAPKMAVTVGYLGSRGTNLRISRNINQPVDGVRPFAAVAASSSDSSRRSARQHHPGREQRLFELPRGLCVDHQAAVARPAVRCVVHLVEVARHQLAELVRLRRPERERHRRRIRVVGLRRAPSIRPQRHLRLAVHGPRR